MITNVLLVDDHPVFRKGLRLLLEDESDFRVIGEAGDGSEALELAGQSDPDVVVMDISMPGMDGIQATQGILSEAPHTKVIALSIHSDKAFVEGMLLAGASGYILKESAPEDIVDGIRAVRKGEVFLSAAITGIVIDEYRRSLTELPAAGEAAELSFGQILSTKLHRPVITQDLLMRTKLHEILNRRRQRALTLISAPLGYGKSILASSWLENIDSPSAWLSLDKEDNNLRVFLTYLIAAMRTQFSDACAETSALLESTSMASPRLIVTNLINDFESIDEHFILVLDDYHTIHEMAIHNLLNQLLQYPSRKMHLVIIARGDPPLNLSQLRALNRVTDIRHKDLRFTNEETSLFMYDIMGIRMDRAAVLEFNKKTEGWVTALRLVALSLRHSEDVDGLLGAMQGDSRYVQDYLTAEVVSHQPPEIQNWLLKVSILERFCAPLCEAVCQSSEPEAENQFSGETFIECLEQAGLFVIALDDSSKWFQFHHLFQNTLQNWLQKQYSKEEIEDLYVRAAAWFQVNNLLEEAIDYALLGGQEMEAAQIVEKQRLTMLNQDKWYILEKLLSKIPPKIFHQRPELLLAQAWVLFHSLEYMPIPTIIDEIEDIFSQDGISDPLQGEIDFFKGWFAYYQAQGLQAEQYLASAVDKIPEDYYRPWGEAELHYALAMQMTGSKETAVDRLNSLINSKRNSEGITLSRLWSGLYFIHWIDGNLVDALFPARKIKEIAERDNNHYADAWFYYKQGIFYFQQYDLENAIKDFNQLVSNRYIVHTSAAVDGLCALSLAYQQTQQPDKADETAELLVEYADQTNDPAYQIIASSLGARLSLLRGDTAVGTRWLQTYNLEAEAGIMFSWFETARITACRVLVAEGSQKNLLKAVELLQIYQQENQVVHNKYQQIVILSLLTLAYFRQKEGDKAMSILKETLDLAYPGGWIWPFIELGAPMFDLLNQFKKQVKDAEMVDYIIQILAAFPSPDSSAIKSQPTGLIEALTERELQVLKLLATALTTDEIARELVVSVNTVRMHTKNIYGKLDAHSRIEAAQRGRELGLI